VPQQPQPINRPRIIVEDAEHALPLAPHKPRISSAMQLGMNALADKMKQREESRQGEVIQKPPTAPTTPATPVVSPAPVAPVTPQPIQAPAPVAAVEAPKAPPASPEAPAPEEPRKILPGQVIKF